MVLVAAADRGHFATYVPAFATLLLILLGFAGWLGFRKRSEATPLPPPTNPTELRSALFFTALYAGVLLGVAAAREWYGNRGLLVVAAISGLTDMDAITLSTAQLSRQGTISESESCRAILVASVSNLFFKAGVIGSLGDRALLRAIVPAFGTAAATGLAWAFLR